jgi:hypothetical protein
MSVRPAFQTLYSANAHPGYAAAARRFTSKTRSTCRRTPVLASTDLSCVRMVFSVTWNRSAASFGVSPRASHQPGFSRRQVIKPSQGLGHVPRGLGGIGDLKPRHGLWPEPEQPVPAGQLVHADGISGLARGRWMWNASSSGAATAGGSPQAESARRNASWSRTRSAMTRPSRYVKPSCASRIRSMREFAYKSCPSREQTAIAEGDASNILSRTVESMPALRSSVEPKNSRRDRGGALVKDYSRTGVEYPVRTPEIVVELAVFEETLVHDRPVRQGSASDKKRFLRGRLYEHVTRMVIATVIGQ